MMGNTYTTIITQAEKAWRQQHAQIIMALERSVDRSRLAACQLEYSIKLNEPGNHHYNPQNKCYSSSSQGKTYAV